MTPILTLIFSWQSTEPAPPELRLIPAKSIDKQRLAGSGLSSKKGAALIKATPGCLTLPMVGLQAGSGGGAGGRGEGLSFSPVGLARSRGSEAAGHILVERRAEGGLGGPGGLMCFPLPAGVGGCALGLGTQPNKADFVV